MGIWLWVPIRDRRVFQVQAGRRYSLMSRAEDRSPLNVWTFKFLCGVHGSSWAQLLAAVRPVGVP
jgi:hypothetical protein